MAKVTLTDLASAQASSIVATINANNALIEAALEKTLSRDGTSPNSMEEQLDMNNERIVNLPLPVSSTEPIRKGEFDTYTSAMEETLVARDETLAALDEFTDLWLGIFASEPATDNDGNTLQEGALYFDSTINRLKVYSGGSWATPLSGSVIDSTEIDATSVGADFSLSLKAGSIDETKLDASVNASLDLADSASQPGHTHLLADVTNVTITAANLNTLDDGADTTLHFHASDRNRANHTGTQTASTISDFNEAAQDAVGAAFDTTLAYNDAGNSMGRAALTGAVTASAGSNTTALGSFTSAQLDAAVSDANVSYTGHTHTLANVTDVTMTVSNLNSLDDGVNSTLHFHASDRSRANHTGTQTASTVSDFNEAAQDAVGGMVDTTLVYNDVTPSLSRAALTGAVTASAGSNTTALGSFTMAQLDTAVSDGNVSYVGHTHTLANVSDVTMTVANLNSLDDGADSTLHFHNADRARANHTGTQTASTISDFSTAVTTVTDPLYQDANAMLDDVAALTDPNADRILFWDDSAGQLEWLTIGTNLTITGTTLNASGGGGGGGLSDADYGDITVSSAGTVMTIDNDVVTYAKMQNVGANSVLARADTTSGDLSEIALANSRLLGRGSTGNVAAIATGNGLEISSATLGIQENPTIAFVDSNNTAGPVLTLFRNSTTPAANDFMGRVVFQGMDSGGSTHDYARISSILDDPTNTSEDGRLKIETSNAGTLVNTFDIMPNIRYGYNNAGANQGVSREEHWIKLASDYALTNATTEQKIFNTTTNGRLTLETGTYFFDTMLYILTMSGTSGNAAFDPIGGGTAVGASFLYHVVGIDNNTPTNAGTQTGSFTASQQTVASMVSATTQTGMGASIRGTFRITTAGTIIPSISLSAAAAATMKAGSYFRIWRAGDVSTYSVGAWD